jgi:hypothetical protein
MKIKRTFFVCDPQKNTDWPFALAVIILGFFKIYASFFHFSFTLIKTPGPSENLISKGHQTE